jgi:hypothetical protein
MDQFHALVPVMLVCQSICRNMLHLWTPFVADCLMMMVVMKSPFDSSFAINLLAATYYSADIVDSFFAH